MICRCPLSARLTSLSTEVARQLCDPSLRQMYTGFLMMSSLHMPIVPDGQVTPGGAAAGTGAGDGAAAVVAGAGSSAVPNDAALVFVGAGTTDARNASGLLSGAGAATSKDLTAGTAGGAAGLAVTAVGGGGV